MARFVSDAFALFFWKKKGYSDILLFFTPIIS
jgi:hypothetical protein